MSDQPTDFLNGHSDRHASLSPEALEVMGKRAATMFLESGIALNDSIAKLASAHPDISTEQIKRVVEFANTATYLALHDKNKTAQAQSSYPQFTVGDASRIVQDLSDGARPTQVSKTDIDYSRLPEKTASADSDALLAELFKTAQDADLDYSEETVQNNVFSARDDLRGLKEVLASAGEKFDLMQQEAEEEYYQAIKTHLLEGHSFSDVIVCAQSTGADSVKVASVFKPVIERLLREKVASAKQLQSANSDLTKVAGRQVNPFHPLVAAFSGILHAEEEITKISMSLKDVDARLAEVDAFIKETYRAPKAR